MSTNAIIHLKLERQEVNGYDVLSGVVLQGTCQESLHVIEIHAHVQAYQSSVAMSYIAAKGLPENRLTCVK